MPETVTTRSDGSVTIVELNRPASLNAFNVQMARELWQVLSGIASDDDVGAVVLTGAGRGFSSGFDLLSSGVPSLPSGRLDLRWALQEVFNPVVLILREMPQPVVAAVNGIAAGIGASYALACDLVVAARSASLLLAFVNVGLVPDGGSTVLISARAGLSRALEMSLLGQGVSAELALEWGLVNRVEDDERTLAEAIAIARRLSDGPRQAQAAIKTLINATLLEQLRAQLALEADAQGARGDSEESAAAIRRFSERRLAAKRSNKDR